METKTKRGRPAQNPARKRQINVRLSETEFEAIWAAYIAARDSEPRLTLAAWIRRKGAEIPEKP